MARDTRKLTYRRHARAIGMVGTLSLCLLPCIVSAQRSRGSARSAPAMGRSMGGRSMSGGFMGSRQMPVGRGGQSFGYGGGYHLFERPALPGYGFSGGSMNGSMYNRSAVDNNSILQRMAGTRNEFGPRFAPNQAPNYNAGVRAPQMVRSGGNQYSTPVRQAMTAPRYDNQITRSFRQSIAVPRYNITYAQGSRPNVGYGYPYSNGNWGRRSPHLYGSWSNNYLPYGFGYYPYYVPNYTYGLTCPSPYYYYGTFPPYIDTSQVYNDPPPDNYVPDPSYTPDGQYQGYPPNDASGGNPNGTQDTNQQPDDGSRQISPPGQYKVRETETKGAENAAPQDSLLTAAVSDIESAWQTDSIQMLSKHIRKEGRIAIMLRGKYQYSLDASDYLDMTRDAFRTTKTMSFTLNDIKRKDSGVYTVNGSHVYQDQGGKNHTVLVSFVLEKIDADYFIKQIGNAPQTLAE